MDIYIVPILFVIVFIVCAILVDKYGRERHNSIIEEKMNSIGGILISSKIQFGYKNVSPYKMLSKYDAVYHIKYFVKGESKNGWVKISLWDDPDWRL